MVGKKVYSTNVPDPEFQLHFRFPTVNPLKDVKGLTVPDMYGEQLLWWSLPFSRIFSELY
jgi:hypothetical protein